MLGIKKCFSNLIGLKRSLFFKICIVLTSSSAQDIFYDLFAFPLLGECVDVPQSRMAGLRVEADTKLLSVSLLPVPLA